MKLNLKLVAMFEMQHRVASTADLLDIYCDRQHEVYSQENWVEAERVLHGRGLLPSECTAEPATPIPHVTIPYMATEPRSWQKLIWVTCVVVVFASMVGFVIWEAHYVESRARVYGGTPPRPGSSYPSTRINLEDSGKGTPNNNRAEN